MPLNSAASSPVARWPRVETSAILDKLEQLYSAMNAGESFPSRRELMERFNASEHVVRGALDELERQGKIIRRVGRGGSIVADYTPQGHTPSSGEGAVTGTQSRTIVTIAQPDGSIFDRALQLLARHPQATEFSISYRLMSPQDADAFELPTPHQKPLGYLIFHKSFIPLARRLQDAGHRVVLVGTSWEDEDAGVPNVYSDHVEGGALLAHHLFELGHRNLILELGSPFTKSPRGAGIDRAIKERGLKVKVESFSSRDVVEWMKTPQLVLDLFSGSEAPTAVICWNDETAIRVLTLLSGIGLRVPQDVSIVGYDNMPQSAYTYPALTTVDSGIEQQLNIALRLLMRQTPPSPNHSVVVIPTLVERDSSVVCSR